VNVHLNLYEIAWIFNILVLFKIKKKMPLKQEAVQIIPKKQHQEPIQKEKTLNK
jgi:hypothetical protein